MNQGALFGAAKPGSFQVSVSSLTLGTLFEAILSFSRQDSLETFWPVVCQQARWLIPSQRMGILLGGEKGQFEVVGQSERGKFQVPAEKGYTPAEETFGKVLAAKNARWENAPWKAFRRDTDNLSTWLFSEETDMALVLPILVQGENIGALLFVMDPVGEGDQAMLSTLGTIYALHTGMAYSLICISQERQEMQQRLVMQEKMASLGNMVAGVAHEVNNPLGAVNSAANVVDRCVVRIGALVESAGDIEALRGDPAFERAVKLLADNNRVIATATERITDIVQSLKNFTRLDEAEFQRADIHQGLDSTLTLVQHELKGRIDVVREYGTLPLVPCYPNQLNQVFMNLFINAAHAMGDGGQLRIGTGADVEHVYIEVVDTGDGIAAENLARIFEPGFTTKGARVGSGLGLSICYSIMQRHSGDITLESTPGKGTTVRLVLPTGLAG
ncbi:MAG: hypothetical protein GKR89_31235 [Candidatus Latescibacteria bacterium]|nr:hypothetical protein [Candidatus Latescibacterota bacterium]